MSITCQLSVYRNNQCFRKLKRVLEDFCRVYNIKGSFTATSFDSEVFVRFSKLAGDSEKLKKASFGLRVEYLAQVLQSYSFGTSLDMNYQKNPGHVL